MTRRGSTRLLGGVFFLSALLAGAEVVSAAGSSRSDSASDAVCRRALDLAEAAARTSGLTNSERTGRLRAVWQKCSVGGVDVRLRASAALRWIYTPELVQDATQKLQILEGVDQELKTADVHGIERVLVLDHIANERGVLGDGAGSRAAMEQSLQLREKFFGKGSPQAAYGLIKLAYGFASGFGVRAVDPEKAVQLAQGALESLIGSRGEVDPITLQALGHMAGIYEMLGRVEDARVLQERHYQVWLALGRSGREPGPAWQ